MDLIPEDTKYAVLGLETNRVAADLPDMVELPNGFLALRHLPFKVPDHWREWVGSLEFSRIEENGLYLFARAPTTRPQDSDSEDQALIRSVNRLYYSLLLSVPFFAHDHQGIMLAGSRDTAAPRVNHREQYPTLHRIPYTPRPDITEAVLRDAAELTQSIVALTTVAPFERMSRANRIFYRGLQEPYCDARTLAFVRTVEAFLLPPVGGAREAFIDRTRTFVGEGQADAVSQMYDIRSAVVHLHDPAKLLPRIGRRERTLILLKRCIQAEALARFCLLRLPQRPQAYTHFQDDQTVENFWRMDAEQRGVIWGPALDLQECLAELKDARVDDETLGLSPDG